MSAETSESRPLAPAIQSELESMRIIGEALDGLSDPEARSRVLAWAASRFGLAQAVIPKGYPQPSVSQRTTRVAPEIVENEIAGVARMTADGELEITARDVKARSTIDAAIRLAHITLYASEKFSGDPNVSSRKVLLPILKDWRVYDGNTRRELAQHKGIHRNGDNLSLDAIAKKEAERYISEILDVSISGAWNPNAKRTKKASDPKPAAADEKVG